MNNIETQGASKEARFSFDLFSALHRIQQFFGKNETSHLSSIISLDRKVHCNWITDSYFLRTITLLLSIKLLDSYQLPYVTNKNYWDSL
jgi:hypothetical protein